VGLTLQKIYDCFVQQGIKSDPRTKKQIQDALNEQQIAFDKYPKAKKKFFDLEKLRNPFADTRLLHGDPKQTVKKIIVGIDVGVGEILLARQLRKDGIGIDLVLSHHPSGIAYAALAEVMSLQADVLANHGFQRKVADKLLGDRIEEVERKLHGANHQRAVDAARLLDIPFMCCHTPADNHVAQYLQQMFDQQKPKTLKRVVELLYKEPEYADAVKVGAGPKILAGKPEDEAGQIFVDMTGGTSGSKESFPRLSQVGIQTIVGMYISEAHLKRIKAAMMSAVIAGHMASDNLGMNLILDKLGTKGKFDVLEFSGFRRFQRR
jgi:hypothetical protein